MKRAQQLAAPRVRLEERYRGEMKCTAFVSAALVFAVGFDAQAQTTDWRSHLVTTVFYEGDSFGTSVVDVYVDGASPDTNFNGQGLNLKWTGAGGVPERPGYVRFDNIFGDIPMGSFITRATLRLTASAASTGKGQLKAGTRGYSNFSESASTYNNLAGRNNVRGRYFDQLYSKDFMANLSTGSVAEVDVTPAIRAFFDNYQDSNQGWPNWGIALNVNPPGAAGEPGTASFYDSEYPKAEYRPRLEVEYLPLSSGYMARAYQPVPAPTAQIMPTAVQDTLIRGQNRDGGTADLSNKNYGARLDTLPVRWSDGPAGQYRGSSSALLRWPGLTMPVPPPGTMLEVADALIRLNATDYWNVYQDLPCNLEVRAVSRPWSEGWGNGVDVPGATYNSFKRSACDPAMNAWQVPGGYGAQDSAFLFGILGVSRARGEIASGSAELAQLVASWLEGETNNGLLLRATSNGDFDMLSGNIGSGHLDPYLSAGLIVIFKVQPIPACQ
ncbi:DNRLRE domain-containing protein [Archangium sp.]|uniref:DNRLRE domain-containing protein n=1 Tax=Archangium sp. TaxID=1872627 RepID=UPI002D3DD8E2|nr:DNRLRE domain-containing protein [Archangium sp.]HYO54096.1 DNRLRE domain-containing protein [Archangium sp.]